MNDQILSLERAVEDWDRRGWPRPRALVVSGSGLAVDLFPAEHGPEPLSTLLPFEVHDLVGHPHSFELIRPRAELATLYLRGRPHAYQGHDAFETVFPARLARLLGAEIMIMTNAAGGLDPEMSPGDLVVVEDQINLSGLNPLWGGVPTAWGPQFPDMTDAYDRRLRRRLDDHARALEIPLRQGVYAGLPGPSYETPAEVRMLRTLGADLVGMSTVLEVIAARHMGMRCLVMSLVSNLGAGVTDEPLDHEEVIVAGRQAASSVQRLLCALLTDPKLLE